MSGGYLGMRVTNNRKDNDGYDKGINKGIRIRSGRKTSAYFEVITNIIIVN